MVGYAGAAVQAGEADVLEDGSRYFSCFICIWEDKILQTASCCSMTTFSRTVVDLIRNDSWSMAVSPFMALQTEI